jgi:hypothetical protein
LHTALIEHRFIRIIMINTDLLFFKILINLNHPNKSGFHHPPIIYNFLHTALIEHRFIRIIMINTDLLFFKILTNLNHPNKSAFHHPRIIYNFLLTASPLRTLILLYSISNYDRLRSPTRRHTYNAHHRAVLLLRRSGILL